jgi:hypothetical protein
LQQCGQYRGAGRRIMATGFQLRESSARRFIKGRVGFAPPSLKNRTSPRKVAGPTPRDRTDRSRGTASARRALGGVRGRSGKACPDQHAAKLFWSTRVKDESLKLAKDAHGSARGNSPILRHPSSCPQHIASFSPTRPFAQLSDRAAPRAGVVKANTNLTSPSCPPCPAPPGAS